VHIQLKIEYVLDLVRFEWQVPVKFFKKLESTNGIYKVRVIASQKSIRILCFQDEGTLVVLKNAFVKKTQKMLKNEIKLAERLKIEYFKTERRWKTLKHSINFLMRSTERKGMLKEISMMRIRLLLD